MLAAIEKKLTFKPDRLDHGAFASRPHERVRFGGDCGLDLDGAWCQHDSDVTILFIHGNRHNMTKFNAHYELFEQLPVSYFSFDYPGYGRSSGSPSEDSLYQSAQAAYEHLIRERGLSPHQIVVYGCSLGGAVALELVHRVDVAGLITESTFTNSHDMARHIFPLLPLQMFLPNRFQNVKKIALTPVPKLLIHGTADTVVPFDMVTQLYEAALPPKRVIPIPMAGHTDSITKGSSQLREAILTFIQEYLKKVEGTTP